MAIRRSRRCVLDFSVWYVHPFGVPHQMPMQFSEKLIATFILLALSAWLWLVPGKLQAQVSNGIESPVPGDVLSGIVIVKGTAIDPSFLRYEVAFLREAGPGGNWIVFAQGDQPVIDDTLAVWDTTVGQESDPVFPDGRYQLRLRVVRTDYNYDEFIVRDLQLANLSATPTPTATITSTLQAVGPTPASGTAVAPAPTSALDILPTLTPFPTPSPQATPVNAPLGPASPDDSTGQDGGLLGQLSSIDAGRFGKSFWRGVVIVFYLFLGLGVYLLLRGLFRRLWRRFQARFFQ